LGVIGNGGGNDATLSLTASPAYLLAERSKVKNQDNKYSIFSYIKLSIIENVIVGVTIQAIENLRLNRLQG